MAILSKGTQIPAASIKVGMKVTAGLKGTCGASCWNIRSDHVGVIFYIILSEQDPTGFIRFRRPDGSESSCSCAANDLLHLYLAEDWDTDSQKSVTSNSSSSPKTIMASISEFFQNLKAKPEERLLKKHGIEDPIGTPTQAGLDLALRMLYDEKREEVIKLVQQKEAEETKEKKD